MKEETCVADGSAAEGSWTEVSGAEGKSGMTWSKEEHQKATGEGGGSVKLSEKVNLQERVDPDRLR